MCLLVLFAMPVVHAAEPKTTYFFGHTENAKGFVVWIVSARAGLCFTDGEPVDVRVRVGGATGDTVVEFSSASAAGEPWQPGVLADKLSRYLDSAKKPRSEGGGGAYGRPEPPTGAVRPVSELKDTGNAPPMEICARSSAALASAGVFSFCCPD